MTFRAPAQPSVGPPTQRPINPTAYRGPSARSLNLQIQGVRDNLLRNLYRNLFRGFAPGGLEAGQEIWATVVASAFTFPANFANSQGKASIASTGTATLSIQKNGVQIGTMVFTMATTATFTTTGGAAQSFAVGDVLGLIAPNPADATLEGIKWTLAAQLPE